MMSTNKPGYILTFTLGLIMLFMFIASYIANKGLIFGSFSKTMVEREKARQLAYGGIQLAISQLSSIEAEKQEAKEQPEQKKEETPSENKQLLKVILSQLNRAQKFTLKQAEDGIAGSITIAIGCQEGKININRAYDFDKHAFVGEGQPEGDMKKVFQELFAAIKAHINADLFAEFEKFLKERKYPLNDVTELLKIKGFDVFKNDLFFDPTIPIDQKNPKIYLTDIFTIFSSKPTIEPWLLSPSMITLLNLKSEKEKSAPIDEMLKNFKDKTDWKTDWAKTLKLLYNIDFNALPKWITPLFNPAFAPKIFSVFSVGTVGKVTVRLWAFLEREKGGKDAKTVVRIRKIYLL